VIHCSLLKIHIASPLHHLDKLCTTKVHRKKRH